MTVHLETSPLWKAAPIWQMPFSRRHLLGTHGPNRRGTTARPPFSLLVPSVWLWCGHWDDLSCLWQSRFGGSMGFWRGGHLWAEVGEAWLSQFLLIAVERLDLRPWSQGVTCWLMAARLLAAVLPAATHRGIVPQQPTLYSMPPEALSSHKPLHSQVPLLAKGWQLPAC